MNVLRWFLGIFFIGILAGCLSAPEAREEFFYFLSGPDVPLEQGGGPRLEVSEFSAAPGYESVNLARATRVRDHELRYWGYHRWVAAPPRLLEEMTTRHLRASGLFSSVRLGRDSTEPDAIIFGHVTAIEELDHDDTWEARLAMVFLVQAPHSDKVLLRYAFDRKAPCEAQHPESVAKAISMILAIETKLLSQAIADKLAPPAPVEPEAPATDALGTDEEADAPVVAE